LTARDIVGGKNFLIAETRIHHGNDLLSSCVGMPKAQGMPQLVENHSSDIGDGGPFRREPQRPTIRVEDKRPVQKSIRFLSLGRDAPGESDRDRVFPELLAEDIIRKHDRIDTVGG